MANDEEKENENVVELNRGDDQQEEFVKIEEQIQKLDQTESTNEETCNTSVVNAHEDLDDKERQKEEQKHVYVKQEQHDDEINIDISLKDNVDSPKEKDCLQLPVHESNKSDVRLPNLNDNRNFLSSSPNNFGPSEEEEIAHQPANQKKYDDSKVNTTEYKRIGWMRHYVALFALVGIVLANMNRQAFNQALVKMIKKGTTTTTANGTIDDGNLQTTPMSLYSQYNLPTTEQTPLGVDDRNYDTFDWDSKDIKKLQSAFSYGYVPFMIFSARISELYGAKWVIFLSGFGSALCCVVSPFFADTNFYLLMGSRVLMGLCQTGVSPALYALLVRWLPPEEASVYLPMMKVGATLGFTFGSVIAGLFTWRQTLYIVATIGFIWSIIWPFTIESDPDQSKFISKDEFSYIRQEIGKLNKGRKQSSTSSRKKQAPWIQIFTHPVVLAFMFTKLTVKMSTDAQTQQVAMYLDSIFNMDDKQNGILNGINYALQAIFTGFIAWSAQQFVIKKTFGLTKTGVRKLYQGICNFGMGLAFISITFNMSSVTLVCCSYLLLSVASMFGAGGEAVLPVDLTTDYAATIMSIANFTANLSGIILPEIVARILKDNRSDPARWNLIWYIVGGFMFMGGLIFTFVVRAELLNFENNFVINFVNYVRSKIRGENIPKDQKKRSNNHNKDTKMNNVVTIQMSDLQSIKETSDT